MSRLDPFLPASLASAAQARELGRLTDYLADPATDDKRKTRSAGRCVIEKPAGE